MATYGQKVQKYSIRVRARADAGLPPRESDLDSLAFYRWRAAKKGAQHRTKLKDRMRNGRRIARRNAGKVILGAAKALVYLTLR